MKSVTKLTLATLVAVQLLNVGAANAKTPKTFIKTLHTTQKEALQDPYFQLKSVKVTELTDEEALEFQNSADRGIKNKGFVGPDIPNVPSLPGGASTIPSAPPVSVPGAPAPTGGVLDGVIMLVDQLIAIGQKIIPTIKEGKAIVTNNPMTAVSVLPRGEGKDLVVHEMGGWSVPVSKHYKIAYTNGFGAEVVSFVYSISFQYNGSSNGKGKYLAGIRASARNITVSWGFDLDATSQLVQISNVGTQDDVIAGATLEMTYTVKNWTRTISTSESFFVSGDGKLYKLDN